MAKRIDAIQDDTFQIDSLLDSDSFISTHSNQTGLPIQPSEQTEKKSLVPNSISLAEPDICGEDAQANKQPLTSALISVPKPLFRSDALITANTGVEIGKASHIPVAGNSYLKSGIRNRCAFKIRQLYRHGDHRSARRRYITKIIKSLEAKQTKGSRKGVKDVEQRPSWLPGNWTMTCETQNSGATAGAGITDRYYVEPITGQRFRSKIEVKRYLETGSKKKSNSDANATPSKKTGAKKKKKEAALNFDFENTPKEVTWSILDEDPESDLWKPSIGEEVVPETTTLEWVTAFERSCQMD